MGSIYEGKLWELDSWQNQIRKVNKLQRSNLSTGQNISSNKTISSSIWNSVEKAIVWMYAFHGWISNGTPDLKFSILSYKLYEITLGDY